MSDMSSGLGFTQSINSSRYAVGLYSSEKNRPSQARGVARPNESGEVGAVGADNAGLNKVLGDILDIGNSRGLTPGSETTLSIIEQKAYARLEKAFSTEKVEQPPQDDYWSPEKTAGRIVGFATNFYEAFAKKNGDSKETLEKFLGIVRGAIDEGIGQAETAIAGVSGGSVPDANRSTISKTREYIDKMLQEFRDAQLSRLGGESTDGAAKSDNDGGEVVEEAESAEKTVLQSGAGQAA